MLNLNRYEQAAQSLIDEKKKHELQLIVNKDGAPAGWDDHHWTVIALNGTSVKIPLHNLAVMTNRQTKVVPRGAHFPDMERHLLMCYLLELRAKEGVKKSLNDKLYSARSLIARLSLFSFSQQTLDDLIDNNKAHEWPSRASSFVCWLQERGIIAKSIKFPIIPERHAGGGDDIKASREKNMPDERALWAICAIRNDIIPTDVPRGVYQRNLRDQLIITSATLGLASPQRAAQEQFVLPKTTLQSKIVELDGKAQEVSWVDWPGSKGFGANRKHFFQGAATATKEVLNYWNEAGEPARILCRFFEKPTSKLCDLLGDYKPPNLEQFDVNKPINNMFVLGYLLGFYKGQKQITVRLTPGLAKARNKPVKQIKALTLEDKVYITADIVEAKTLFGTRMSKYSEWGQQRAISDGVNTIAELQEKWVTYMKKMVPTFPYRYSGQGQVKLEHALIIGTGGQFPGGGYKMSSSYYAIETLRLAETVTSGLRSRRDKTIFERRGFASDISLNPYQLRHWSNTKMQESLDMSDLVIAMISGRVKVETNAEYDNRTDEKKMQPVQRLFRKKKTIEEMKQEVRVVGHHEYQEATKKAAIITSTGICTQQVTINPCHYLNDFESHCALCTSSCHFAHDDKAIQLLKDDLQVQEGRLLDIKDDKYIHTNKNLQAWFLRHHRNTFLLEQLITLMQREDLKIGTAIKFVNKNSAFRLTDLDKLVVEEVKVLLPDSQKALLQLIKTKQPEAKSATQDEQNIANLFAEFGIQGAL